MISDFWGEAIFFILDVDSRTILKRDSENESLSKYYKSYFHMLLHPKILLIPSISMKDKIGILIDATVVKSPAKYILSTSNNLWVTLHADNVIRIWGMSDGRWLMWSPKELFLTKLKRIISIPTYEGYLLWFGEEGDVYIINLFRMRLLKHSSIDIDGVSHIKILQIEESYITFLITDDKGKITTWKIKKNKFDLNIQTFWADVDFEIDFEMSKLLYLPDEEQTRYLLVYTPSEWNEDLLMITNNKILVKI